MGVKDRRELARCDPVTRAERDGALDDPFELADIAGPVVTMQCLESIAGEFYDVLAKLLGETGTEMFGEKLDVGPSRSQRGDHEADRADAVIEFLVKSSLLNLRPLVIAG